MPDRAVDGGATQLLPIVRPRVAPPGRGVRRIAERVPLASIYLLIITITAFQRFVIPGTVVSVALPVAFLVLVGLAAQRQLRADVSRVGLYLAAVAACLLSSLAVSAGSGTEPSVTSLLLLLVLYVPLCFRTSGQLRDRFPTVLEFFQKVMIVAAFGCLLQWALQVAGLPLPYQEDLFEELLPPGLIFTDEYNTTDPIIYGSSIFKSNGFVFLEPSFASQFLALAIIIQLMLGGRRWRLALFGAALLSTVSGTGLLLLAIGMVVLAIRRGGRWTARAVAATILVAATVSLTPVGELLAVRSGETTEAGSSGNARFVAPYSNVANAIGSDQAAFAVGRGAGSVDIDTAYFNPKGLLVNYPVLPKFVGEYGVPAALIFLAFMLTVLLRNTPSPTLGVMSIMIYFVLSGSLLQPQTVYLVWLLTGLFAAARAGEVTGRRMWLNSARWAVEVGPPTPAHRAPRRPNIGVARRPPPGGGSGSPRKPGVGAQPPNGDR